MKHFYKNFLFVLLYNIGLFSLRIVVARSTKSNVILTTPTLRGKVCTDLNPVKVTRCCIDYYQKDFECIECPPGTHGVNCSQVCPPGFFGNRCLGKCNCSLVQKCNRVLGCVDINYSDERCEDGTCEKGVWNNTDNMSPRKGESSKGNSHTPIVITAVGSVTLLLLILGLLIKRNVRSSEKSLFGKLYKVFDWRRTYSSERNEQQMPQNRCEMDTVDEGIYDDIRVSRMVPDCGVGCGATMENRNQRSRYQDPRFLTTSRTCQETVEYSRCDKGKSNVYNLLSLRNGYKSGVSEYDRFPGVSKKGDFKMDGAYGGGCELKSLAECKENESISDPPKTYSLAQSADFGETDDHSNLENKYEKFMQSQYYVLEKGDTKTGDASTAEAKEKSNTLSRMLGKLSLFRFRY